MTEIFKSYKGMQDRMIVRLDDCMIGDSFFIAIANSALGFHTRRNEVIHPYSFYVNFIPTPKSLPEEGTFTFSTFKTLFFLLFTLQHWWVIFYLSFPAIY